MIAHFGHSLTLAEKKIIDSKIKIKWQNCKYKFVYSQEEVFYKKDTELMISQFLFPHM